MEDFALVVHVLEVEPMMKVWSRVEDRRFLELRGLMVKIVVVSLNFPFHLLQFDENLVEIYSPIQLVLNW